LQLQWFLTGQLEWAQLHGVHGLVYWLGRFVAENNVLATRSLRQLRLGGIAVVLEPASSRRKANRWRLSICSRR
jgi:hypothetical protein